MDSLNLKEKKALLKKLESAANTCFDSGQKYGIYSVGCSSVYEAKCGVCGEIKRITETRDFAYFFPTIRKLKQEIADEKSRRKTEKLKSKESTSQSDGE